MRAIRVGAAGLAAAVGAGIIVGGLARLAMRFVAIAAGAAGEFTWAVSLAIVLVYLVAMLPGAVVAAATTQPIRWFMLGAVTVRLADRLRGRRRTLTATAGYRPVPVGDPAIAGRSAD